MDIRIEITAANAGKYLDRYAARVRHQVHQAMHSTATLIARQLHADASRQGVIYTRRFVAGFQAQADGPNAVRITNTAPHAPYIEAGRPAGAKQPPIEVIKRWARAKLGNERAAYPIARAISRRGIKPKRFLTNPSIRRYAVKRFETAIVAAIRRAMTESR